MPSTITDRLYGENSAVAIKAPCAAVSVANIALSGLGAFTTPGGGSYTPNNGDRILVIGQADQTQNGIYSAQQTAWQRTGDFDGAYDVVQGTLVVVVYPNGQSAFYQLTTPDPIIGTSVLAFSPYAPPNQNFPQTPAEAAAGVAVINGGYIPGDLRRYGGDPTGVADSSVPWQNAIKTGFAFIPAGCKFYIANGAAFNGQVTIVGQGPTSKLVCDSTILTVSAGTGSFVDNFWMENLTAPWIITRDPTNWAKSVTGSLQQSNTVLGYQPTVNDTDLWAGLTAQQQNQQIGPTLLFQQAASGITVSRIYGRFVRIDIRDATNSTVRDCDFRGGKGQTTSAIGFDNWSNGVQRGSGNRAINNRVQYASFSGILFAANDDFVCEGNHSFRNGESGTKTYQAQGVLFTASVGNATAGTIATPVAGLANGAWTFNFVDGETKAVTVSGGTACAWAGALANTSILTATAYQTALDPECYRGEFVGNRCYQNYYDGMDCLSSFNTTVDVAPTNHLVSGNYSYQNGGDGINADGRYNTYVGNHFYLNNDYGFWGKCSFSLISGNSCISNNTAANGTFADLLSDAQGNTITSNRIYKTSGVGYPIYAGQAATSVPHLIKDNITVGGTNFFGNVGAIVPSTADNIDSTTGSFTEQCFCFMLRNNAGTLQHIFYSDMNQNAGGLVSKVAGASSGGWTNTPTGPDLTTNFAAGAKIGSANTNAAWFNTASQDNANELAMASISLNTTGTALLVGAGFASININGVAQNRLIFQFFNATTGAAQALSTANIPAGTQIQVQFLGKLA